MKITVINGTEKRGDVQAQRNVFGAFRAELGNKRNNGVLSAEGLPVFLQRLHAVLCRGREQMQGLRACSAYRKSDHGSRPYSHDVACLCDARHGRDGSVAGSLRSALDAAPTRARNVREARGYNNAVPRRRREAGGKRHQAQSVLVGHIRYTRVRRRAHGEYRMGRTVRKAQEQAHGKNRATLEKNVEDKLR